MVVEEVGKPDVQIVHVGVQLGVVRYALHPQAAGLGVGHTHVGIQGHAVEELALAVQHREVLIRLLGDAVLVTGLPTKRGVDAVGLSRPAVTHIVILQAAL